ncbi:MAG: VOC family protein [Gemmatimonadota bacterium]|nr:VOC family protein [Gemmatimonadota bacterium]
MLGNADVVAFVPTRNSAEARAFYERVLGLEFVSEDPFALVFSANGVTVRIADVSTVRDFKPAPFTILGWYVPNADAAVRELRARGVAFERFPGMQQSETGIWTSPSGAKVAWFKDPDGNILSVTEP